MAQGVASASLAANSGQFATAGDLRALARLPRNYRQMRRSGWFHPCQPLHSPQSSQPSSSAGAAGNMTWLRRVLKSHGPHLGHNRARVSKLQARLPVVRRVVDDAPGGITNPGRRGVVTVDGLKCHGEELEVLRGDMAIFKRFTYALGQKSMQPPTQNVGCGKIRSDVPMVMPRAASTTTLPVSRVSQVRLMLSRVVLVSPLRAKGSLVSTAMPERQV